MLAKRIIVGNNVFLQLYKYAKMEFNCADQLIPRISFCAFYFLQSVCAGL